ncbi:MAG: hypothetical protein AB7F66_03055 [Bacteriovoracia bacterium]
MVLAVRFTRLIILSLGFLSVAQAEVVVSAPECVRGDKKAENLAVYLIQQGLNPDYVCQIARPSEDANARRGVQVQSFLSDEMAETKVHTIDFR